MAHGSAMAIASSDDPIATALKLAKAHRVCESHRDVYAVLLSLFYGPRALNDSIETSYTEVAFMASTSDSTIRRAIAKLVAVGLIRIDERARPGVLVLAIGPSAYRPDPQLSLPFSTELSDAMHPGVVQPAAADAQAHLVVVGPPQVCDPAPSTPRQLVCAPALAPARARAPTDGLGRCRIATSDDVVTRSDATLSIDGALARESLPMGSIEKESNTLIPHRRPPRAARARDRPHASEAPIGDVIVDAINGLATRTAANFRADKADLVYAIESAIADPATHPSQYGLVAEAVLDGRLERQDLDNALAYVRAKRLRGEIRQSPGALFRALMRKRLGDDLRGGMGK